MANNAYLNYLLNRYRQNQQKQMQAEGGGDSGGGSNALSNILKGIKYGRQGYKWYNRLFGEGTNSGAGGEAGGGSIQTGSAPQWEASGTYTPAAYNTGSSVGAGAMPMGTASAGDVGLTGASSGASSFGSNGVGMTAGGYASLAAPLVMALIANSRGSGVNQPVQNQMETNEGAKYFKDYITNKGAVDPNQYNLPGLMGDDALIKSNPLQYLYTHMHDMGTAGNSKENTGYNDQQIDDMIYKQGVTPEELKAALGYELPDWSKGNWGDFIKNKYSGPMYDTSPTFLG